MNKESILIELLSQIERLNIKKQIDFDKFYLYSLITHSTAIEGSTITEIENQLMFDDGITSSNRSIMEQLMNIDLKNAYNKSIAYAQEHCDITIPLLQELSGEVMKNTGAEYNTALGKFSSAKGDIRLLNVTAGFGGRSYLNYSKIASHLSEFCNELNATRHTISQNDTIQIYKTSFDAHYNLVTIHPWADGNGRMARLIMNQIQMEFNLIPTIIKKDSKLNYINALVTTREQQDLSIFREFMIDEHINNLQRIIDEYEQSETKSVTLKSVEKNIEGQTSTKKSLSKGTNIKR